MYKLFLIIAISLLFSCSTVPSKINYSDGINSEEGESLAIKRLDSDFDHKPNDFTYFVLDDAQDTGKHWKYDVFIAPAFVKMGFYYVVEKKTGGVYKRVYSKEDLLRIRNK